MLGTVLGLIEVAASLGEAVTGEANAIGPAVRQSLGGMNTTFYTTGLGIFFGCVVGGLAYIADSHIEKLIAQVTTQALLANLDEDDLGDEESP